MVKNKNIHSVSAGQIGSSVVQFCVKCHFKFLKTANEPTWGFFGTLSKILCTLIATGPSQALHSHSASSHPKAGYSWLKNGSSSEKNCVQFQWLSVAPFPSFLFFLSYCKTVFCPWRRENNIHQKELCLIFDHV